MRKAKINYCKEHMEYYKGECKGCTKDHRDGFEITIDFNDNSKEIIDIQVSELEDIEDFMKQFINENIQEQYMRNWEITGEFHS